MNKLVSSGSKHSVIKYIGENTSEFLMHLKLGQSYTFSKEMFKFKLQLTVTCSLPHEAMPSSPSSTLSIRYLFSVSLSTVLVDRGASRSNPGVTPIRILLVTMHGKLDPNWLKKKEFIG